MPSATVSHRDPSRPLSPEEATEATSLARRAAAADGSEPLSEQFRLSLTARDHEGVDHLLAYAADDRLVGYAQVRAGAGGEHASAELVVDPRARRGGVGTSLLAALPGAARVWSHGVGRAGVAAEAFAAANSLVATRSLHVMGRSLQAGPAWPRASLADRYAVRSFEPGRDEQAWLDLNAAAFAHHPEQGSLRRPDLDQRMAQPWWDPAGLILVVEAERPGEVVASHWTKVDPPTGEGGTTGEVYVVAVSPDHRGEGLGRAVTALGLDHLKALGLADVVLYVDEDNVAAVHTYEGLGFTDREVHRQFVRA